MARLGNIQLFIESESDSSSIEATNYPAERSESFTDHVLTKPDELSLSGFLLGSDYVRDKKFLKDEMKKGTVFQYVGRNIAKDVIILSVDGNMHNAVMNGSEISLKLQTVRFAATPWKAVNHTGQKKPVQKGTTPSAAVYHPAKKGDTYWLLSRKYGSTIAQLRTWNKFPDTEIKIGAKLRVK